MFYKSLSIYIHFIYVCMHVLEMVTGKRSSWLQILMQFLFSESLLWMVHSLDSPTISLRVLLSLKHQQIISFPGSAWLSCNIMAFLMITLPRKQKKHSDKLKAFCFQWTAFDPLARVFCFNLERLFSGRWVSWSFIRSTRLLPPTTREQHINIILLLVVT